MKKLLLIILSLFSTSAITYCQTYPSDTAAYYIISAIGNKFLTVRNASPEAGTALEIRTYVGRDATHPAANQVWTLQEFGSKHHYFIKSRQGKVIDLKDGKTENGSTIQMWGFGGYPNHRWQLIDAGGGYFYIKNWTSGKMLDVSGGVNENGRTVWSYQQNNSLSQKWRFVKTPENPVTALLTGEPTVCENNYSFMGTGDIELNRINIGYCPQKEDEWESVVKQQFGISAKNRTNHYIGKSAVGKDGVAGWVTGRNWYPMADMKKVYIGNLCRVGYFDAVEETTPGISWFTDREEKDFNLFVKPASPFSYMIEKSIIGYNPSHELGAGIDCRDNWGKCGDTLTMEGEITPDEQYLSTPNNPWLGIKNYDGNSVLFQNQRFGMYGPWVTEEIHCYHPEIHPAEMLWSETVFPNVKYLMMFQDDSDRFGYYSDYPDYTEAEALYNFSRTPANKALLEKVKSSIHPWAGAPLSGQFFIAFEIDTTVAKKISYTIDVQSSKDVVTTQTTAKIPASEYQGKTRILKLNGQEVFRVTEYQENANDVGIRFELFKSKNPNKILGYMVISAAVSRNIDGGEGFMIIRLDKGN